MDRATELLEYYAEYPPANVVLSLVHLKREKKPVRHRMDESTTQSQMRELSGMLGQSAEPMPAHLREMADWAIAQCSRRRLLEKSNA
jgi:hypothetical protein